MGLKRLINKHRKINEKSDSIKKKICNRLDYYIKTLSLIDELTYTNNLQNKIDEHYGFSVPRNYVFDAIEEIFKQEAKIKMEKHHNNS